MRAIAVGREDCPIVVRTFRAACGRHGDEALQAYVAFVKYLAMTARRRLQVHTPGCPYVGDDELAIVDVIASAQASLQDCDERTLREHLAELIDRPADESLLFVAQSIARLLQAGGLALSPTLPQSEPPTASRAPARPRLVH